MSATPEHGGLSEPTAAEVLAACQAFYDAAGVHWDTLAQSDKIAAVRCQRAALTAFLAARAAAPDALLCSQCGERPSAMVKIGTTDGWCVTCLDEAAESALRERVEGLAARHRHDPECWFRRGKCTCWQADLAALLDDPAAAGRAT